jgi:hypothetical protein
MGTGQKIFVLAAFSERLRGSAASDCPDRSSPTLIVAGKMAWGSSSDREGKEMKNSSRSIPAALFAVFLGLWAQGSALAQETTVHIAIKDHRFSPVEVHAPANTPIAIVVKNLDPTPEEFESKTLGVEKLVAGGGSTTVRIRPLSAGRYRFVGEYHEDTAAGFLVIE